MYQVIKRDGKHVDFDLSKITEAIRKAFEAQERQYLYVYLLAAGTQGHRGF